MAAPSYYQGLEQELQKILSSKAYSGEYQITPGFIDTFGRVVGQTQLATTPPDAQLRARAAAIQSELAAAQQQGIYAGDPAGDARLTALLQQFQAAYDASNAANEARYQQLLTGYQDIANTFGAETGQLRGQYGTLAGTQAADLARVGGQYGAAATQLGTDLGGVTKGYADRQAALGGMFTGLGERARQDVTQQYDKQRAGLEQDLIGRGLGNTTIRNALAAGIGTQEAADMARLNEQLRREQIGYQSQWGADALRAQEQQAAQNYAAALQGAQFGERQAGEGYQAGLAGLQFGERGAMAAADLGAGRLGAIERREDTAPTLADVANISLQIGKSAAERNVLPIAQQIYGQYAKA